MLRTSTLLTEIKVNRVEISEFFSSHSPFPGFLETRMKKKKKKERTKEEEKEEGKKREEKVRFRICY